MTDIQIRAAELRDAEDLTALFNCPGVIAGTYRLPWRSVEEQRERLTHQSPDRHVLVAVLDGRVVGMLGLHLEPGPRRRHCANLRIAVHDAYQGQGVGSALMVAMIDLADKWLGLRRLELSVYTDNARAIRLYGKFGFVVEGTAHQVALRDGSYADAHYMARLRPV